jgi:hypothetical protein
MYILLLTGSRPQRYLRKYFDCRKTARRPGPHFKRAPCELAGAIHNPAVLGLTVPAAAQLFITEHEIDWRAA